MTMLQLSRSDTWTESSAQGGRKPQANLHSIRPPMPGISTAVAEQSQIANRPATRTIHFWHVNQLNHDCHDWPAGYINVCGEQEAIAEPDTIPHKPQDGEFSCASLWNLHINACEGTIHMRCSFFIRPDFLDGTSRYDLQQHIEWLLICNYDFACSS